MKLIDRPLLNYLPAGSGDFGANAATLFYEWGCHRR